jgi:peptide deformylase
VSEDRTIDSGEDERLALESEIIQRREAALAHVVKFGDPVLKSKASPVDRFGEKLRSEVDRMIAIMRDGLGVGLAATQLGVLRRVLVLQSSHDAQPAALVNPVIEWRSEDLVTAEEGCLSLPRISVDVERPLHVAVSALDVDGEQIKVEASGLEARILQHELDHLDGVLILDHTPRAQRRGALRALREGGSYSPPFEEGEDGAEEGHREPRTDA